jgi:uncharacterized membrane protein
MRAQLQVIKGYFTGIHRIRRLLVVLIALVISDGVITRFLISSGLGREANPFLQPLVGGGNFLIIKVVGALLAAFILWDIYKHWPRLAVISSRCFVGLYSGIVAWNLSVFFTTQV